MADNDSDKNEPNGTPAPPVFTEAEKTKARRWFDQGKQVAETRNYDYGVECYITGLGFWPEAVDEGHRPLQALSIQRRLTGGKKPGMRDNYKYSMTGKDAKKAMLNAEHLLSMDPKKSEYMDGILRNANKGGFNETIRWVAPLLLEALKIAKKPSTVKFKAFRQILEEAGDRVESQAGDAVWYFEQAVDAMNAVVRITPSDGPAQSELVALAGKLTIVRGKYGSGEDFRDSLHDAERAKLLHDSERAVQTDAAVDNLQHAARQAYEADRDSPAKLNKLVEHLLRRESKRDEDEAIGLLGQHYEKTNNYSFQQRADDVRLKQLNRELRGLKAKAAQSGVEEDSQQYRLAGMDYLDTQVRIFRERTAKYPTDMRVKFKLGQALFQAQSWDDAIPIFQEAQIEPRSRIQSLYYMGRCFFEKDIFDQAAEVLQEAVDAHEIQGDQFAKDLLYWLGRSYEGAGNAEQATATYGKLLRQDYNYGDGEVRKRLEELKKG